MLSKNWSNTLVAIKMWLQDLCLAPLQAHPILEEASRLQEKLLLTESLVSKFQPLWHHSSMVSLEFSARTTLSYKMQVYAQNLSFLKLFQLTKDCSLEYFQKLNIPDRSAHITPKGVIKGHQAESKLINKYQENIINQQSQIHKRRS